LEDNELLEKAMLQLGESLSRKNSTMATEEDAEDSDSSPNEEEEEKKQ
jgi:hypothetical protein